jgi:hypothetical protein
MTETTSAQKQQGGPYQKEPTRRIIEKTLVVKRREGEHVGMHVTHLESMRSDSSEKQKVTLKGVTELSSG